MIVNAPLNSLSFGQVSTAIIREFYKKNLPIKFFPVGGNTDVSSQNPDPQFDKYIRDSMSGLLSRFNRKENSFKLWHINQSLESLTDVRNLMTFHETDSLTNEEINILQNQDKIFVTSKYTKAVFEDNNVQNVVYVPLGFDSHNFHKTNKSYFQDGRIVWGHISKFEERKKTARILKLWAKKYGNNRKHFLHISCYNPFLRKPDGQPLNHEEFVNWIVNSVFNGQRYWNIKFLPYVPTNAEVNDIINAFDIAIGVAGNEGFDLGLFHAAALGKHIVSLNAHVYKDYLNDSNAVLIEPSGLVPAQDGIFFNPGQPFSQGFWFDWKDEDFFDACDKAEARYNKSKENIAGLELQKWTYTNTANVILSEIQESEL